jgi:hypothetical protein
MRGFGHAFAYYPIVGGRDEPGVPASWCAFARDWGFSDMRGQGIASADSQAGVLQEDGQNAFAPTVGVEGSTLLRAVCMGDRVHETRVVAIR